MKKVLVALVATLSMAANAATFMSGEWAEGLCAKWNDNDVLVEELTGWMENDLGRGFKVMTMKRRDCTDSGFVQLTLKPVKEDGEVYTECFYGGVAVDDLDYDADYLMTATTKNWLKMGTGSLGPAGAMLTGRLKFKGPKGEAMANMGPFKSFLQLVDEVEDTDYAACPQ